MVSTSIRRAAAKRLRANTTPHERALWRALKELPLEGTHFRRQAPIGRYVVDFLCPAAQLIIELDGGHHNEDETVKRDRDRQLWLEQEGCSFGLSRRDIVSFASGIPRSAVT
jgi:very-short-patch-repair endonuclease